MLSQEIGIELGRLWLDLMDDVGTRQTASMASPLCDCTDNNLYLEVQPIKACSEAHNGTAAVCSSE